MLYTCPRWSELPQRPTLGWQTDATVVLDTEKEMKAAAAAMDLDDDDGHAGEADGQEQELVRSCWQ